LDNLYFIPLLHYYKTFSVNPRGTYYSHNYLKLLAFFGYSVLYNYLYCTLARLRLTRFGGYPWYPLAHGLYPHPL